MSIEQIVGWFVNLIPPLLIAWFTAWAYSRRERDRLVEVWRRERNKELLDSMREQTHSVIQALAVVTALKKGDERPDESWTATLEALRGSASIRAAAGLTEDQQLLSAAGGLFNAALDIIYEGKESVKGNSMENASAILKRCEDLLNEKGKRKHWWDRD